MTSFFRREDVVGNYVFFNNIQAVGDVVLLKTVGFSGAGGVSQTNTQQARQEVESHSHRGAGEVIYCPECGHPNSVGSRFCENCGTKLVEEGGLIGGVKKLFIC